MAASLNIFQLSVVFFAIFVRNHISVVVRKTTFLLTAHALPPTYTATMDNNRISDKIVDSKLIIVE